jgi:CheY-like chemotaxis protein
MQAIDIANAFRPQIVFMDIDMPQLNGLDAARSIRAQAWAAQIVICALTGFGQDSDRERSAAAGIDYHFVKPVDARALNDVLLR